MAETGCPYRNRCPLATAICAQERPALRDIGGGQRSACHHAERVLQIDTPAGSAGHT
jgi:peptide/nickel transport system ATP-binding protein/oligopeptide transport system ATP-binding protein